MKGYEVKVPTWYAMINLLVVGAFAILFLYSAVNFLDTGKSYSIMFLIVAILFMFFFLGISIYVIAKGRYPWSIVPREKF